MFPKMMHFIFQLRDDCVQGQLAERISSNLLSQWVDLIG